MPHDCLTSFWGGSGENLHEWLDLIAFEDVRRMSKGTWFTICALQNEVERATGAAPTHIPRWLGGLSPFPDDVEADFRAAADMFLADLAADQFDDLGLDHHTHSIPIWLTTPPGIPQAGATTFLTGDVDPPTPDGLLGRIRNALGS